MGLVTAILGLVFVISYFMLYFQFLMRGLEILILEFQFHGGLRLSIQNIDRQQRPLAIAFLRVLSL